MMNLKLALLVAGLSVLIAGCSTTQTVNEAIGDNTLEVLVMNTEGSPLSGIEVDVWGVSSANGPPQVFNSTDENGRAVFGLPLGEFLVGFNSYSEETFPSSIYNFIPERQEVTISSDMTTLNLTLTPK